MNLEILTVGPLETNTYLLYDDRSAILIDPGDEPDCIMEAIAATGSTVTHIIYTHAHWDHIGAGLKIKEDTGAEVVMGRNEMATFQDSAANLKSWLSAEGETAVPDRLADEGDVIQAGGIKIKVLNTPGHSPGAISLLSENSLFTGDLIFRGSVGRTDLPGGNTRDLLESIKTKVMTLEDTVTIYPGHGLPTTVGDERRNNPFLKGA